jgi:hypothetical protein
MITHQRASRGQKADFQRSDLAQELWIVAIAGVPREVKLEKGVIRRGDRTTEVGLLRPLGIELRQPDRLFQKVLVHGSLLAVVLFELARLRESDVSPPLNVQLTDAAANGVHQIGEVLTTRRGRVGYEPATGPCLRFESVRWTSPIMIECAKGALSCR